MVTYLSIFLSRRERNYDL